MIAAINSGQCQCCAAARYSATPAPRADAAGQEEGPPRTGAGAEDVQFNPGGLGRRERCHKRRRGLVFENPYQRRKQPAAELTGQRNPEKSG